MVVSIRLVLLQRTRSMANTVPGWFISELWIPQQVTHLPLVWDILLPVAYTPDRRDQWLLSLLRKTLAKWGKRKCCQSSKAALPVPGFEPRMVRSEGHSVTSPAL